MRKITWLLVVVALLAAACSTDDGAADPPASTAGDDEAAADDTTTDPTPEEPADRIEGAAEPEEITIWVPSSLALDSLVETAVADATAPVTVLEEPATYDESLDGARRALEDGQFALVAATHGQALVDDGAALFVERAFEDEDEDAARRQLGVWLLAPPSPVTGFRFTQSTISPEAREVGRFVQDEADAYADSLVQGGTFKAAGEGVKQAAERYGARVGGSAVARGVAKFAGPVAAVLDFLKTMHDFTVAATEAIDAESQALISLYDTGLTAAAMISDAVVQLCQLEAPLISGEVSPAEARELVETLQRTVPRAANVAVETALELEEAGEEGQAAQILQLRQRNLDAFFDKAAEIIDEIDSRPPVTIGSGFDEIVEETPENFDALADILFPVAEGNESTHSNGRLTAVSEGETDIVGIGQLWWAPSTSGPGLDELLPCGGTTLCGPGPLADNYTAVFADFADPLTLSPDRIYQYAFVFDRDSDAANNYVAGGAYPSDTWDQSDIRYEVAVNSGVATLTVTEGPGFSRVDSGARVHIVDNRILALIPQNEIGGGPTDPAVPMRVTSFWHLGDFGEGPDQAFNIDLHPVVGEPYWLPATNVYSSGPGGAVDTDPVSEMPIDPTALSTFQAYGSGIDAGLAMFQAAEPTADDVTPLRGVDPCFANEYFADNRTLLRVEREAYEYDGVSIQVRRELHDSDSAAAGAAAFAGGSVTQGCRLTLLNEGELSADGVQRTLDGDVTADRIELGGTADGLVTTTFTATKGTTFIRIVTVGPDNAQVDDTIVGALRTTFSF